MTIELTIGEAEFLKRLVEKSREWNNGDRVADVYHAINGALLEESQALAAKEKDESDQAAGEAHYRASVLGDELA